MLQVLIHMHIYSGASWSW